MTKSIYREIYELIGIVAIFVSLIFVGLELRQTSAIARIEASNSFKFSFAETARETAFNPEFSKLLADVRLNGKILTDLTPQEYVQLRNYYMSVLYSWYALFQSVQEGILDAKELELTGGGGLFNSTTFREMWPVLKNVFSQEFVEYFETLPWSSENQI